VPAQEVSSSKEVESLFVAQKAFEDGFYEVSLGLLERFARNYPNSPRIMEVKLLIGQCYFYQNRFLDALKRFEELLNQPSAKNVRDAALYWIAEVHFKGANYGKAASYYRTLINDFPSSSYIVHAYYSLGWCLFEDAQFRDAMEYFGIVEERFAREPQARDASLKILECLYRLKDYTALKGRLKKYMQTYEKDALVAPYLYFYMAEADYYLDNFSAAADSYAKVISWRHEKLNTLALLGSAWSQLKLRKYKEAQETLASIDASLLVQENRVSYLLAKAIAAFQASKLDESKALYEEVIAANPHPQVLLQAYLGKADALYNIAEYAQAIAVYREALEKVPLENVSQDLKDKLYYGLAWAFLKEGEFKEAIESFRKVVRGSEDKTFKVAALCQIGDAYQDSGDYRKAQEVYDSILRDYPDSLYGDYVQYQIGLTLFKTSDYNAAIMAFHKLEENFPHSKLYDDAVYVTGLSFFQAEDYNASRETFEKFNKDLKDSPLRAQAVYLLGTSLYNLGKYQEAIEVFRDISRVYSSDTELSQKAEYEIADCYYQMGNEKEAVARFKMLRSKYPDSGLTPEIMWWLGEYYYRQADQATARRYFLSLIQDFSKSNLVPDAYYVLGSLAAEESKFEEAIGYFRKAIEAGRSDLAGQASVAIADIYVRQQNEQAAVETYQDVIRQYPHLAHLAYPKLADIYRQQGRHREAADFYRKSLEVVPLRQMPDMQFMIAQSLQAQGLVDEAIEEYLKVAYLYTERTELTAKALLRAAGLYEGKEGFKEAIGIYERVVSMGVEEAKYAQERIDWINMHTVR